MANAIDTTAVLNGLKVNAQALTFYRDVLKGWHKQAGSKPTDAMLYVPHLLGKRPGVEALHIAMTLRAEGCTVAQFCLAGSCGPANNYRRALVKAGWFTATVEGKPYAFKLSLTAKGADKLAKAQANLDAAATVQTVKPVKAAAKAKGKAKAKKAKAERAQTLASVQAHRPLHQQVKADGTPVTVTAEANAVDVAAADTAVGIDPNATAVLEAFSH